MCETCLGNSNELQHHSCEARCALAVAELFKPLTYPSLPPPNLSDLLYEGERRRQGEKMGLELEYVVRVSWTARMKVEWAQIMAQHGEQFKTWDQDQQSLAGETWKNNLTRSRRTHK